MRGDPKEPCTHGGGSRGGHDISACEAQKFRWQGGGADDYLGGDPT